METDNLPCVYCNRNISFSCPITVRFIATDHVVLIRFQFRALKFYYFDMKNDNCVRFIAYIVFLVNFINLPGSIKSTKLVYLK